MATHAMVDEVRLRRFARLAAPLLRSSTQQGFGLQVAQGKAGTGLEFLDLRAYATGEDARHIDWRQSQLRNQLLMRSYRDETASDWTICVDGSASMQGEQKWQRVCELAVALAYLLLHVGHRVSFIVFAERIVARIAAGRGQRQFAAISHELQNYLPPASGGGSLPGLCAPLLHGRQDVFLLSDFLRADLMREDLLQLCAHSKSLAALQVLARDEVVLARRGSSLLTDTESGERLRLELDSRTVQSASAALAEHNAALQRVMQSLNIHFSAPRSGGSWEQTLMAHFGHP